MATFLSNAIKAGYPKTDLEIDKKSKPPSG
jgi:hypothetical protein